VHQVEQHQAGLLAAAGVNFSRPFEVVDAGPKALFR
jgi:hypothetical protein